MNADHMVGTRYPILVMDKINEIETYTLVLKKLDVASSDA